MRNQLGGFLGALVSLGLWAATAANATLGVADPKPAGTLVVPMVEANPFGSQDTLIVVNNVSAAPVLIHVEFWDVNGVRIPSLAFNHTLAAHDVFALGSAAFLAGASPGVKVQLTDVDGFYRGFATIDAVTEAPTGAPTALDYPLLNANVLEGWIYYVRLFDGSSNGISALHVEATGVDDVPFDGNFLEGFYNTIDNREELDEGARLCIDALAFGAGVCEAGGSNGIVNFDVRIFTEAVLNGSTRAILFAWNPGGSAPSGSATFTRFDESGGVVDAGALPVNRVVSVFPFTGEPNGWAALQASVGEESELYSFTFNAANPDVSRNWDAIFTNPIVP